MKRMIDPLLIAQISAIAALNTKDIKDIQDLLEGKEFFDGSVTIEQIGGDKGIKAAKIPTDAGIYKGLDGLLIVTKPTATALHCLAFYDGNIYFEERTTTTETNFVFDSSNIYPARDTTPTQSSANLITSGGVYSALAGLNLGSKLYLHRIAGTVDGNVYDVSVISNESTPYDRGIFLNSYTVLCAGSLINSKAIIGYDMDTGFIYLYKVGDTGISFTPQSFGGTMVDTVTPL